MSAKQPQHSCYPGDKIEQLPSGEWVSRDAQPVITARWNAEMEHWERCGPLKPRTDTRGDI